MRNWLSRKKRYEDLSAAIEEHLAEKIDELMESGLSREEAAYAARRVFGNTTRIEERSREVWQWPRIEPILADVKFALRQLAKSPAFTATAVLTLALGIGANTGVFSLTRALLMKSLPVEDPGRLVRISLVLNNPGGTVRDMPLNSFMIDSLQRHAHSLAGIFGWTPWSFRLQESDRVRIYDGALVSGNAFEVLGLRPAVGRLLRPEDDQDGGGPDGWATVLSYPFWHEHFGGDRSVLGRHVTLSDHSVTIIGIAPRGFEGVIVTARPDFYLPLHYERVTSGASSLLLQRGNLWLMAWARVKSGISIAAAKGEVQSLFGAAIDETLPAAVRHVPVVEHARFAIDPGGTGWTMLRNDYARPLLLLQVLVGVVLLVCCVNLAGLCLARASAREHEFAIRAALGAARTRIMQQVLVESLLLAFAGGALAIAFSWATDRTLLHFMADRQAAETLATRPDIGILILTSACAVGCALLFGLVPAWIASHFPLDPALRTGSKNQSHGEQRNLLARCIFLPAQLSMTLGLIAVAAMLSATVVHLRDKAPAFRRANVLLFRTDFGPLPENRAEVVELYRRLLARIRQTPGVESATAADNTPLSGNTHTGAFASQDGRQANASPYQYELNDIGAGYFGALSTKIITGRDFSGTDADADTCILNHSAARALFPTGDAIGRTVQRHISSMSTGISSSRDYRVIGIAADTPFTSLRAVAAPMVYLPFGPETERLGSLTIIVRARTAAMATAAYGEALRQLAPKSPETDPVPLSRQFDDSIARERLVSAVSEFFAILALLLSGIGVYGLTASWVARRTSEIGIRMALGATQGGVMLLVLRQIAVLLVIGTLAGGILVLFAGRAIRTFLFGVSPASPVVLALAVASLAATVGIATLLPARRAASVDPMEALRAE